MAKITPFQKSQHLQKSHFFQKSQHLQKSHFFSKITTFTKITLFSKITLFHSMRKITRFYSMRKITLFHSMGKIPLFPTFMEFHVIFKTSVFLKNSPFKVHFRIPYKNSVLFLKIPHSENY